MRLSLQIDLPELDMIVDVQKIAELFDVHYVTPGATLLSDGRKIAFLKMEIDGAKEFTEEQANFLRKYTYHLTFLRPTHKYTEAEAQELDEEPYGAIMQTDDGTDPEASKLLSDFRIEIQQSRA